MRNALLYDAVMAPFERLGLGAWRRYVAQGLRGRVLEVGAGTGANLPYYPPEATVILAEGRPAMLSRTREKATRRDVPAMPVLADAHRLPFADESFDFVVVTLALCTVASPHTALREIRRVLRPSGELRLFEHVRHQRPPVAALQDVLTPLWRGVSGGCHLNRATLDIALECGFELVQERRGGAGWLLAARLRRT